MKAPPAPDWISRSAQLHALARRQLFFIGGAPRSGTTWLQQILDAHPDISCRGEALFARELATPLDALVTGRRRAIGQKNEHLFRHTGGFPPPDHDDADFLLGSAVLLALARSSAGGSAGGSWRAIGEKTPENVFLFPRLQRLFPEARFIGIARDPRDTLTSAWHFFRGSATSAENEDAGKTEFIRNALPAIVAGMRGMIAITGRDPEHCCSVTYESLIAAPVPVVSGLFRFLGVSDSEQIVASCLEATSFARQTGGRPRAEEQRGAFLRKGVVGDWTTTLTPAMNAIILDQCSWAFAHFGWKT